MVETATQYKELFQTADYTKEKHVPVIDVPEKITKGEFFDVTVSIGKEIAHPNTTQHHIEWVDVYFQPQGDKYPYQIERLTFSAHGSSVKGADTSTVYTHHGGTMRFKTDLPGTLFASSCCNIHGLWENSREIAVG